MYRTKYSDLLNTPTMLDYGAYLNCERLLTCQKELDKLCNGDELQFQIVHQVEELWMKLMIYSLIDILEGMQQSHTLKVLNLWKRVHFLQTMMMQQLDLLETMSPKDYQQIRLQLGNGSGQESPGFRILLKMPSDLWHVFDAVYLTGRGKSVEQIYDSEYCHDESYAMAEALIEFDELLQKFRSHHVYLIQRSIGLEAKSLKGRPVELLQNGVRQRFFPELWDIRNRMTDTWGGEYGQVRESISQCPMHR
jgi:tryptophan 2,3-dioxygenase